MIALSRSNIAAWRRRAHVHTDRCRGAYEPCGEHHAHDDQCGNRPLVCFQLEEPGLSELCDGAQAFCDIAEAWQRYQRGDLSREEFEGALTERCG